MHARSTLITLAVGLATVSSPALGQDFSIPWSTIDSGGGTLSVGPYTLSGTIGQHDAHPALQAGPYTITGGFWPGVNNNPGCSRADLAAPFGVLDFFDLTAFISAFNSRLPAADFNNDAIFNFFDITTFIIAFGRGCP